MNSKEIDTTQGAEISKHKHQTSQWLATTKGKLLLMPYLFCMLTAVLLHAVFTPGVRLKERCYLVYHQAHSRGESNMIESHGDFQSSCSKVGHVSSTHIMLTNISDVSKSDVSRAGSIILLQRQSQ